MGSGESNGDANDVSEKGMLGALGKELGAVIVRL
jgi:hypothetical protein